MKYCVPYNKFSKAVKTAEEITIQYDSRNLDMSFLEQYQNKKIIFCLDMSDEEACQEIEKIKTIKEHFTNLKIAILLNSYKNYEKTILKIKDFQIDFFTKDRVNNWDIFMGLINFGVSDIYIVENLGFELDKISKVASKNNVAIRVFPNVAQSAYEDTPALKKFFIRPEDINFYSKYVDVFEIFGDSKYIDVLYKIYANDKKWYGQLKEIIIGFSDELKSPCILKNFAEIRSRCGKKCIKGSNCRFCERIQEVSKVLDEKGLVLKNKVDKK